MESESAFRHLSFVWKILVDGSGCSDIDFDAACRVDAHGTDREGFRIALLTVIDEDQHILLVKTVVGAVDKAVGLESFT